MHQLHIKRVYDERSSTDGYRVLIDKLWPRGIKKEKVHLDNWMKDIAPSNELRNWFKHDPKKWTEFKQRYIQELNTKKDTVSELLKHLDKQDVTLLYSAKDEEHNNAVALQEYLNKKLHLGVKKNLTADTLEPSKKQKQSDTFDKEVEPVKRQRQSTDTRQELASSKGEPPLMFQFGKVRKSSLEKTPVSARIERRSSRVTKCPEHYGYAR